MGNSASNANNPNRGPALPPSSSVSNRTTSASPGPGNPHRSMRTKKKSLELPDLANLSITHQHAAARGRPAVPAKTASIPIPTQPQGPFNHYREAQAEPSPDPRTSRNLDSASDVYLAGQVIEPSTHQPFPPVSRAVHYHNASAGGAPRGRQQPMSNARHQAQVTRLQELYDRSHTPAAPPSSPATSADSSVRPGGSQRPGFVAETVRSSIPIALGKAAKLAEEAAASTAGPMKEDLLADPVPVKIVWKGGGRDVVLARAGDNEWKGRQPMERESPQSNTWSTTVSLRPGTHHIRFLIDGTWRVADDLPTAVDDQGSLANYVAVPLNYGFPPTVPTAAPTPTLPQQAQQAKKLIPGQSFWSADSSADGEGDVESTTDSSSTARKASSSDPKHAHTPQSAAQAAVVAYTQARWTNVLPLELIEAAREEEAYLAASAGQYEGGHERAEGDGVRARAEHPACTWPAETFG
ncbi:unnamed protein product [Cyclocybe aegerita]|uniref:AMP-activated protein kinase glycogen-binding domain-containing protein n=1 Tax=Cyclocybe aegerita TaxID=1973307 RepID=A0A8S0WA85_CYCAE|nr:unnamed protein product [Cyclocybe aegerita]